MAELDGKMQGTPEAAAAGVLGGAVGAVGIPSWLASLPPEQQKAVVELGLRTYGPSWTPQHASEQAVAFLLQRTQPVDSFRSPAPTTGKPIPSIMGARPGRNVQVPLTTPDRGVGTSVLPRAEVDAARASAPASAPYLADIITTAAKYKVPWQLVWGVIRHESAFNPAAVGDGGKSHGLAQIYGPAHPTISAAQARNPKFAIDFIARNLAANHGKYGDWGLAALAHNSPQAAQHMFTRGMSSPKRAPFDKSYLTGVFAGLDKLGFTFEGVNQAGIEQALQAGSSAGSAVALPDPSSVRQKVVDYLRGLYFREPRADEVEKLVGVFTGAVTENAAHRAAPAANPFAGDPDRGGGLVHPAPGAKITGRFGDKRPTHTHGGTDYAAPEGTPTFAAVSGYVEHRSDPKGFGTYIILRGDDGRRYTYGHLSARTVADGAHVAAGAVIGKVGSTGRSTGPHLHFEVRTPDGKKVNPEAELAGATALADEGEVQSGALATTTEVDPEARLLDAIRGSAEYKQLYGSRQPYESEGDYAKRFVGEGQALLGQAPPGEAVRVGLSTGQEGVTAGYVSGLPQALGSSTFRQRLYKQAELFNRLT